MRGNGDASVTAMRPDTAPAEPHRAAIHAPEAQPRGKGGHPTVARSEAIGTAVVAATIEAFSRHGGDFSVDRVAAMAGVSKQAIYRRWRSKTALLTHAIDTVTVCYLSHIRRDLPDDPLAALKALAWRYFDNDCGITNGVALFLQIEALRHDAMRGHALRWHARALKPFDDALGRILTDPGSTGLDIGLYSTILLDMLRGAGSLLVLGGTETQQDKAAAFERRWQAFVRMLPM